MNGKRGVGVEQLSLVGCEHNPSDESLCWMHTTCFCCVVVWSFGNHSFSKKYVGKPT